MLLQPTVLAMRAACPRAREEHGKSSSACRSTRRSREALWTGGAGTLRAQSLWWKLLNRRGVRVVGSRAYNKFRRKFRYFAAGARRVAGQGGASKV